MPLTRRRFSFALSSPPCLQQGVSCRLSPRLQPAFAQPSLDMECVRPHARASVNALCVSFAPPSAALVFTRVCHLLCLTRLSSSCFPSCFSSFSASSTPPQGSSVWLRHPSKFCSLYVCLVRSRWSRRGSASCEYCVNYITRSNTKWRYSEEHKAGRSKLIAD